MNRVEYERVLKSVNDTLPKKKQGFVVSKLNRYKELITGSKAKQLKAKKEALEKIKNKYNTQYDTELKGFNAYNKRAARKSFLESKKKMEYQDRWKKAQKMLEDNQKAFEQHKDYNKYEAERKKIMDSIKDLNGKDIPRNDSFADRTIEGMNVKKDIRSTVGKKTRLNRGINKNINRTNEALMKEQQAVKDARVTTGAVGTGLGIGGGVVAYNNTRNNTQGGR